MAEDRKGGPLHLGKGAEVVRFIRGPLDGKHYEAPEGEARWLVARLSRPDGSFFEARYKYTGDTLDGRRMYEWRGGEADD